MNQTVLFKAFAMLALSLMALSCSDKDRVEPLQPRTYNVSGKVEKGPFISGSTITIQPMDSKLQVLGSMFNTTITDNVGSFSFGSKEFQAPYAEMMATGYFFNEVKGELSKGVLVLRALVDLSDHSTVNVNILTHLKYIRIKKLIESGKSFKEANTQAQKEILAAFGLQKYADKDVSQYSITAGTDESAALIAVSSLLLANRSEGELTEYLSALSQEFGADGMFSEGTRVQMKKDKFELRNHLKNIQNKVINRYSELGMTVAVKELTRFFDWDDDGTAGNEILKEGESVTLDKSQISVPKEGGEYVVNINSPIPVYISLPMEFVIDPVVIDPGPDSGYQIYDEAVNKPATITSTVEDKKLTIQVGQSQSRKEQISEIKLYDCLGNAVASLTLTVAGDNLLPMPPLGTGGGAIIGTMGRYLAEAYSYFNIVEQYYYYNKQIHPEHWLSSSNSYISASWEQFWQAGMRLLWLKEVDEQDLKVYQDYCNVFYAMYCYSMVVGWGDIPYNYGKRWINDDGSMNMNIKRVDYKDVFADLKTRLLSAIENLDEKKNNSIGSFFFVSKDVARIVLANIYMYEGNWDAAKNLLAKVRSNGYYPLDETDEYKMEGNGVIFALIKEPVQTRGLVVYQKILRVIPLQSITDVYLSSAECEYHLGNSTGANSLLNQVTRAKGITVASEGLTGIKEARAQLLLHNGNYFAFLKRNNLAIEECGIQEYQKLFPIPSDELNRNASMTQNPGY